MRMAVLLAAIVLGMTPGAAAQDKLTAHTLKAGDGPGPAATIADAAFLTGSWSGDGLGGLNDEHWGPPRGGAMVGVYRLVRDGKPAFYELLTISEHGGSLVLRLKHFNPDMTGWEEKDQYLTFPLVGKGDQALHFGGLTYAIESDGALAIYLAMRNKEGAWREEAFRLTRVTGR